MSWRLSIIALMVSLTGISSTFGAGFAIYEQGASATAQAGAFVARADDVSAVFYNPAGLTQLKGTSLSLGTTVIMTKASLYDNYTSRNYDAEELTFTPSTLYAGHKFGEKLAVGFGFFTRFGLGMDWGKTYTYNYLVTDVELKTYSLSPVVAYEIAEGISVSAGLEYIMADVELAQMSEVAPGVSFESRLTGDNGSGNFGFNISFHGKFAEKYRMGLVYRSAMDLEFEGDLAIKDAGIKDKGEVTMGLPQGASLAFAADVTDAFQVEFDVNWVDWTSYDELNVKLDFLPDLVSAKDWEASMTYRLGGQYKIGDAFAMRAGILYDENPVPDSTMDTTLPDSDRYSVQIGGGYTVSNFSIDLMYMYLMFKDRELNTPNDVGLWADFEETANLFGLSLNYSF